MEHTYGWWGKVLWVDLRSQTSWVEDISEKCETFIGCRGLAIDFAWRYMKPGTGAYDEENLLMYFNGPVCGTPVLGGGRSYFFGVGAQSYPEMYTRSSIGGRVGEASKRCGFDGYIFKGKSEKPAVVEITEEGASFHNGAPYWGRFSVDTQKLLKKRFGEDAESCVIGPAGENRVRIAGIFSDRDNAAAQAGFGAVMGDKKLKAIVFHGHKATRVKDLPTIVRLRDDCMRLKAIPKAANKPLAAIGYGAQTVGDHDLGENAVLKTQDVIEDRVEAAYITEKGNTCVACGVPCHLSTFSFVKGTQGQWHKTLDTTNSTKCIAPLVYGWTAKCEMEYDWLMNELGRPYRWPMNFRTGAEVAWYINNMGLNSWELIQIFMWLTELECRGEDMDKLTGIHWDVDDPTLLPHLTEMLCYREGFGDKMAEGTARLGEELGGRYLQCSDHALHGMNAHSLGTCCWFGLKYPDWIVPALLDATGTRDPMSDSGHKYCDFGGRRTPFKRLPELAKAYYYGAEHTIDPDPALYGKIPDKEFFDLGYLDKEYAAKKQEIRGVIMGVGVFCDTLYPQTLAPGMEETGYHGDWEMESKLLTAVTGVDYTEERLEKTALMIWNMERAYSCLDIGRTRDYDMYIIHCHDARGGDWTRGIKIDARRFGQLLDRYYALEGWDEDGIPTAQTLKAFGLSRINAQISSYREQCKMRRQTHPRYEDVPANLAVRGTPEFEQGREYNSSVDCGRFAKQAL